MDERKERNENGEVRRRGRGEAREKYQGRISSLSQEDGDVCLPRIDAWETVKDTVLSLKWKSAINRPYRNCNLSAEDARKIQGYWVSFKENVSHLDPLEEDMVHHALEIAYLAHKGQTRKSGEPFIIHPIAVAKILGSMNMDADTIAAGLLHDTVEDTSLTFRQIEEIFGESVRRLVEGETKVSKLPKLALEQYADEQAENLRQMFIAMTQDYRIIIIKLADRLHNMRTLEYMSPEKQRKIAQETLEIFAPLAHRLGIWNIKSELEDIAFMYLYPKEYSHLNRILRRKRGSFKAALDHAEDSILERLRRDKMLKDQNARINVGGRMKDMYALWLKMRKQEDDQLETIHDVVAIRVVIGTDMRDGESEDDWKTRNVWLCYHVLGLVQHLPDCPAVPSQVKDYISFPKPNGYQSLHTSIMYKGQVVEVQIRSEWMHQIAEYGMAAHWLYKESEKGMNIKQYKVPWLNVIKEWQKEIKNSREFVDAIRRELLGRRVFIFLRDGKILNLNRGATVTDAAFQIHTEVGLHMTSARINGKPVPFSYELNNGDLVCISTSPKARPCPEWIRFAKLRSTRAKLRAHFRTEQRETLISVGWDILGDFFVQYNDIIESKFGDVPCDSQLDKLIVSRTPFNNIEDLCIHLAQSSEIEVKSMLSKMLNLDVRSLNRDKLVPSNSNKTNQKAVGRNGYHVTRHNSTLYPGEIPSIKTDLNGKSSHPNTKQPTSLIRPLEPFYFSVNGTSVASAFKLPQSHLLVRRRRPNGRNGQSGFQSYIDKLAESETIDWRELRPRTNVTTENVNYADPEMLCPYCMPIRGDNILGVRDPKGDIVVHRLGCFEAETLLSRGKMHILTGGRMKDSPGTTSALGGRKVDPIAVEVPVKWTPWKDEPSLYPCDINVYCRDRRFLLSDVSSEVTRTANIINTWSKTTGDDAVLQFSVLVEDLDHLQKLMNAVMKIDGVMSCERVFGQGFAGKIKP